MAQAIVVERQGSVNEQNQVRYHYELQLLLKKKQPVTIRESLQNRDQAEPLATTINQQLDKVRVLEKEDTFADNNRFLF